MLAQKDKKVKKISNTPCSGTVWRFIKNLTFKNIKFSSWSRFFVSVAGLLAPDQLASIFLNVEQLIQVAW
jgi:hypothetical protein